jgi:Rieske Fe-S protein
MSAGAGLSRRRFCAGCCQLLAGAALAAGAEEPNRAADPEPVKLTRETRAALKAGDTRDYRRLGKFFLLVDAAGIYAVTAICTHRGCSVTAEGPDGFGCPCHDSEYDRQGRVTQGPAALPLRHLQVREREPGGLLEVDVSREVDVRERL